MSARYPGTASADGLVRLKSTGADEQGKAVVRPRAVGLPQGWPGQERLQIETAGKDMWSTPWKLAQG